MLVARMGRFFAGTIVSRNVLECSAPYYYLRYVLVFTRRTMGHVAGLLQDSAALVSL